MPEHTPQKTRPNGQIDVTLEPDGIIICALNGYITEDLVKNSLLRTNELANELRASGRKPLLLIDAKKVSGQTSGARTQAKKLGQMGLERIAVTGPGRGLGFIVQYLIRAGGMSAYARIFRSQASARQWLKNEGTLRTFPQGQGLLPLLVAISVLLSGIALIGWATHNNVLTAIIPGIKPINPVSALTFIIAATGILCMQRWGKSKGIGSFLLYGAALWTALYGLILLLRNIFGVTIPVDAWLFADAVTAAGAAGATSQWSAGMFVLLGLIMLLVLTRQQKPWQRFAFHAASTVLFLTAFAVVINYSFGLQDFMSTPSIQSTVCFLLLNHALQLVALRLIAGQSPLYAKSLQVFNRYVPAIFVCASMVIITGIAWQQSKSDVERSVKVAVQQASGRTELAINNRISGYVNALRGYRSFFDASDTVQPQEFRTYFTTSELQKNYPGFTAITFVPSVPTAEREQFIRQLRQYASPDFPKYQDATVFPVTNLPILYPTTLVEPATQNTVYGFDLGSNHTRLSTLEQARDTGDLAASDIIDLNASRADKSLPKRPGFYLTIPVYVKPGVAPATTPERRERIFGFVNAVFECSIFFGDVFKDEGKSDATYIVRNTRSGEVLYTHQGDARTEPTAKQVQPIRIANQEWQLETYTTPFFTVGGLSPHIPKLILGGGGLLTVLATLLMLAQLRRRDNALQLAESMTEDLNRERNTAVATQQKDEAILSSIGDAVFAVDNKSVITVFNPAAEEVSGYASQEAIGKQYHTVLRFVSAKDGSRQDHFVRDALGGTLSSMKKHTVLLRKDGTKVAVADSAAPIRDARGKILGAIIVFRDVTKELALDRAKDEFISIASHQLRTPLGSMRWNLELLMGNLKTLPKESGTYVKEAYNSTMRMLGLVADLLSVARIEQGRVQDMPQKTNLSEVIAAAVAEMLPIAAQRGIRINGKALENNAATVVIDAKRFREVIGNILSNAVKYTPAGGNVTLGLEETKKDVVISVADTGIGIPPDEHAKMFSKFYRAKNVTTTDTEGSGLGLFVVKSYVEAWGGKIWFTSELNKGTTFYVSIPRRPHIAKTNPTEQQT